MEEPRATTVLEFLGVLSHFRFWKIVICDGAANRRILYCALISRAFLFAAILSGVRSNIVPDSGRFAGVIVGFVGLYLALNQVDNMREIVRYEKARFSDQWSSHHKYKEKINWLIERVLYIGFMMWAPFLAEKLGHNDVAGMLSIIFFTLSVMAYQFETKNRFEHLGLVDGLLSLQAAAMSNRHFKQDKKSCLLQMWLFWMMLGTLVFRVYVLEFLENSNLVQRVLQQWKNSNTVQQHNGNGDEQGRDRDMQRRDVQLLVQLQSNQAELKLLLNQVAELVRNRNHRGESSGTTTATNYAPAESSSTTTPGSGLWRLKWDWEW